MVLRTDSGKKTKEKLEGKEIKPERIGPLKVVVEPEPLVVKEPKLVRKLDGEGKYMWVEE